MNKVDDYESAISDFHVKISLCCCSGTFFVSNDVYVILTEKEIFEQLDMLLKTENFSEEGVEVEVQYNEMFFRKKTHFKLVEVEDPLKSCKISPKALAFMAKHWSSRTFFFLSYNGTIEAMPEQEVTSRLQATLKTRQVQIPTKARAGFLDLA